jgi:hypothetical protein
MKGTIVFYNPRTDKIMLLEYDDIKKQHSIKSETHTLVRYCGMNSKNIKYVCRKLFKYIGVL